MKTEKEKMLNGDLYAPSDSKLVEDRMFCKMSCFQYNQLSPSNESEKVDLLSRLFGKSSPDVIIEPSFWCDYGYNIYIGNNFYSNHNLVILDEAKVLFGNNVFIGPNCGFYTAGHPLDIRQRNLGLEYALPITIGDNVWIGANVCVLPGVTIGNNTIIGAGSVVSKDIPDNSLAMGNPCHVIRKINNSNNQ